MPSLKERVLQLEPLAQLFYDRLFTNPEICSRCYSHVRHVDVYDVTGWGSRLANPPSEHRAIADGGQYGQLPKHQRILTQDGWMDPRDVTEADTPKGSRTISYRGAIYCRDCGGTGGAPGDSVLPNDRLEDVTERIVDVLRTMGLPCHLETLRDVIRSARERDHLRQKQTEAFGYATGRAIRAGYEKYCPFHGPPR